MKIIRLKKKGMTLIEAIISVALLSILIVPVSTMVINSVNTTKNAAMKQEATFIGQKLLEEIKAYEEINLKGTDKFQLLDGEFIKKENDASKGYDYYGSFKRSGFNVEIKLIKNNSFDYEVIDKTRYEFKINDNEIINNLGTVYNLDPSKELYLEINGEIATVSNEEVGNTPVTQSFENNKVIIELDKEFSKNIRLNITNNSATDISVYVKKFNTTLGDIVFNKITGIGGVKSIINTIYEPENGKLDVVLGDLYEINVLVSNGGDEKFRGQSMSNIVFKR